MANKPTDAGEEQRKRTVKSCCDGVNHAHRHTAHPGPNGGVSYISQTLALSGLHCGDCAAKLEKAISRMDGVDHIAVDLMASTMSLRYDASKISYDAIVQNVRRLGYDASERNPRANGISVFRIEGMDCADCAAKLENIVASLPSVREASVNYGAAKMTVKHDGTAAAAIIRAVGKAGYAAVEEHGGVPMAQQNDLPFWKRNRKVKFTLLSGLLFLLALLSSALGVLPEAAAGFLYAAAIVAGGFTIARSAMAALKSRTVGMDLLMTIAVLGAAAIGEWQEGAAVVVLFSLGETLEAYTMDRTRKSIRGLMDLAPAEALVRRGGRETMLAVRDIRPGDVLIVKPGEKIAMDGIVIRGRSTVNQAPITGESIPVEKAAGDEVFAGTINQHGALEIEATKLPEDNTLSRIIRMVEEAQAQKAPSQRFVDAFAKYYTPAVIAAAVGVFAIPALLFRQPFDPWFYRALMLLVVACPCALVISTPVSIVAAIGHAARNGILIKGGAYLERLGAVSAVAFDKTGTLTSGIPQVAEVIPFSGKSRRDVLRLAAAIEAQSEHPVAAAIVRKAEEEGLSFARAESFTSVTGRGAQAEIDGIVHYIGSPRWFEDELRHSLAPLREAIERSQSAGQTVLLLGTADELAGMLTVADEVREQSGEVIRELRSAGVSRIVMLTGDNRGTARAVASQVGGIDFAAELLPEDKVAAVRRLMEQGGVAMVGDGINDAPALAAATVGIAMGAAGTDTALETADVALMADDLSKLPYAIRLSRRALGIIKQNIAFSLLVKALFIGLIFFGHSTLWMAVLADTGTSLIVIANGMRLLRGRHPKAGLHPAPAVRLTGGMPR